MWDTSTGCLLYGPWPGIKPTSGARGDTPVNWATLARAAIFSFFGGQHRFVVSKYFMDSLVDSYMCPAWPRNEPATLAVKTVFFCYILIPTNIPQSTDFPLLLFIISCLFFIFIGAGKQMFVGWQLSLGLKIGTCEYFLKINLKKAWNIKLVFLSTNTKEKQTRQGIRYISI